VIVIELLKKANAMFFSGGRPPITNAATALTRLGSEVICEVLDELFARDPIEDLEIRKIFELHRNRCKRRSRCHWVNLGYRQRKTVARRRLAAPRRGNERRADARNIKRNAWESKTKEAPGRPALAAI
jgi:hypothetical protein